MIPVHCARCQAGERLQAREVINPVRACRKPRAALETKIGAFVGSRGRESLQPSTVDELRELDVVPSLTSGAMHPVFIRRQTTLDPAYPRPPQQAPFQRSTAAAVPGGS